MAGNNAINFVPPQGVRRALARGLELKDEYGGKGLVEETVDWARHLAAGRQASPEKARKMHGWFARHKADKRPGWARPPTPGYVAWLLWGGDAGVRWAKKLCEQMDRGKRSSRAKR